LYLFVAIASGAEETKSCCSVPMAKGAYSDASIFNLGDSWTDQDGNKMHLGDFEDEIVVVAMFFSNCQYVCPRIVADVKRIEEGLSDGERKETRFVLASMDSLRDTPDVLKDYQKKMKLSPNRWTLLHGDDNAVQNLAAVLGVKYKREMNGDFGHSVVITVVDRGGVIVHQQDGLGADPAETVGEIQKLAP
jgi:protein SCO1/2